MLPTRSCNRSPSRFIAQAIERAAELDDALLARGKELEAAGYHQQVKVTPSSTLLFMLRDGSRTPVHRRPARQAPNRIFWSATKPSHSPTCCGASPTSLIIQRQCPAAAGGTGLSAAHAGLCGRGCRDRVLRTRSGGLQSAAGSSNSNFSKVFRHYCGSKPQTLLERYGLTVPDLFQGPESTTGKPGKAYPAADLQAHSIRPMSP